MPNCDRQALIEPRKGRGESLLPPFALVVSTPQDLSLLSQWISCGAREEKPLFLAPVHTARDSHGAVAVVGPMIGAPQAVMVLEKMIARGVQRVVTVGWCGSLQPEVKIGDIVLPTGAFSEEGTSRHYPLEKNETGPSARIFNILKEKLREPEFVVHLGKIWTTDAPYRETPRKVQFYQEAGALAVEMETSALFQVAHFRGIELGSILVVSDELFDMKWTPGFRENRFQETRRRLAEWIPGATAPLR